MYIYNTGNANEIHSIIKGGLTPGGRSLGKDRQSVFFTAVNPMDSNQVLEEVQYDLDKPRITVYKNTWKSQQNIVYWCKLKFAQRKGLQFYQTRSHANILFNTLPAICIEKVVYMKTGEELHCKEHQSPRLSRVVLAPTSQHGRQDPPNPDERKSTDHQSEERLCRETCRPLLEGTRREHPGERVSDISTEKPVAVTLTTEFQVYFTPPFSKWTQIAKTQLKGWFNNLRIIRTGDCCYKTSTKQRRWIQQGHVANACSLQKGIDRLTKKGSTCSQFLVMSSKRILPRVPDMDRLCGRPCTSKHMICWGKPETKRMVIVKLFGKDGAKVSNIRKSLSDSGWTEEQI